MLCEPKSPSTDEWIKTLWHINTVVHCSPINKNEILPFAAMWMNLEIITLSEASQTKTHDITYMSNLKKNTSELIYKTETDSQTLKINMLIKGERGER